MIKFVKELPDEFQEKLKPTLKGKGSSSQFEDAVLQLGIEEQWNNYRESAYRNKAIKWCKDNGIRYE